MNIFIDSSFSKLVDKNLIYELLSISPYAQLIIDRVNVYCLESEIFDLICPPKKYIDPTCLREKRCVIQKMVASINEVSEFIETVLRDFWRHISECERPWANRGCYVHLDPKDVSILRDKGIQAHIGPSILLAIDRVQESADKINRKLNIEERDTFKKF